MTTTTEPVVITGNKACAWCNERPTAARARLKRWRPRGGTVVETEVIAAEIDVCGACEALLDDMHQRTVRALARRAQERAAERAGARATTMELGQPEACSSPEVACSTCGGYGHGCQACASTGCPMRCECCRRHTWRKAKGHRDQLAAEKQAKASASKYPHTRPARSRTRCDECDRVVDAGEMVTAFDMHPGERLVCEDCTAPDDDDDDAPDEKDECCYSPHDTAEMCALMSLSGPDGPLHVAEAASEPCQCTCHGNHDDEEG